MPPKKDSEEDEMATTEETPTGDVAIPAQAEVTLTVGDGEPVTGVLDASDQALITSRVASNLADHPAQANEGYWSNPAFAEPTDEEKAADSAEYAKRFPAPA